MADQKIELSPLQEGLAGAVIGAVIGGLLLLFGLIAAPTALAIAVAVGAGSLFNGWRRGRNKEG